MSKNQETFCVCISCGHKSYQSPVKAFCRNCATTGNVQKEYCMDLNGAWASDYILARYGRFQLQACIAQKQTLLDILKRRGAPANMVTCLERDISKIDKALQ